LVQTVVEPGGTTTVLLAGGGGLLLLNDRQPPSAIGIRTTSQESCTEKLLADQNRYA
jgi:hypothetical protein